MQNRQTQNTNPSRIDWLTVLRVLWFSLTLVRNVLKAFVALALIAYTLGFILNIIAQYTTQNSDWQPNKTSIPSYGVPHPQGRAKAWFPNQNPVPTYVVPYPQGGAQPGWGVPIESKQQKPFFYPMPSLPVPLVDFPEEDELTDDWEDEEDELTDDWEDEEDDLMDDW